MTRSGRSRRSRLSGAPAALAALALGACSELSLIEEDSCGNRVIEAGEDCDGQPNCGASGTAQACRHVCEAHPTTPEAAIGCPEGQGYQCGADDICRKHSGAFEPLSVDSTGTTRSLLVGDLNGDGCAEVARATLRGTQITAFASQEPGRCAASEQELRTRNADAPLTAPPLLADLAGSGELHLITADRGRSGDGLFLYRPEDTPALSALLHSTARLMEPEVTALPVRRHDREELLLIAEGAMAPSVALLEDPARKALRLADAPPPGTAGTRALAAGDLDAQGPGSASCDEVAIAVAGQPQIRLYRTCDDGGGPAFAPLAGSTVTLAGSAAAAPRAKLAVVDHDGDGNLDLLVNAEDGAVHVAHGLGDGRFHSSLPLPLPPALPDQGTSVLAVPDPEGTLADPEGTFAAGDFDLSLPGLEIVPVSCASAEPFRSPLCDDALELCEVVVDDIDADGDSDIVSLTRQPEVIVRRSLGDGRFHVEYLETRCAPRHVTTGDVDGDGIVDISFFDQVSTSMPESPSGVQRFTALTVAYGNAFADPSPPVPQGLFERATALVAGRFLADMPGEQLYALQQLAGPGGAGPVGAGPASALALVAAQSGRLLQAPFYFPTPPEWMTDASILDVEVLATAAGRFSVDAGAPTRASLAVIARVRPEGGAPPDEALWLTGIEDPMITLRPPDASYPVPIACDHCVLAPLPSEGGEGDDIVLLGAEEIAVYEAGTGALTPSAPQPTPYRFSSVSAEGSSTYLSRPALVRLGSSGAESMLIAPAADGSLVALWRGPGGIQLEELDLRCTEVELMSGCRATSVASISIDGDDQDELVVAGPGLIAIYDIDAAARALVRIPYAGQVVAPPPDTDLAAVAAGDLDGDGVDDLVFVPSSTVMLVLRGKPVLE